jgi:prolyl-tRNA editing enzyme YbaK/EbsC (Cys-tRNA(Pro) deacylase)
MKIPVYVERSIFDLEGIFINGGKRGFLIHIDPNILPGVLEVTAVEVAV